MYFLKEQMEVFLLVYSESAFSYSSIFLYLAVLLNEVIAEHHPFLLYKSRKIEEDLFSVLFDNSHRAVETC